MNSTLHPSALIVLLACTFAPVLTGAPAGALVPAGYPPTVLFEGEELVYNVSYGIIDLGQVRIMTHERVKDSSFTAYRSEAVIQSYKGVPFVDLHAIYQSVVDSTGYSHHFLGRSREDADWEYSEYSFDYGQGRILVETGRDNHMVERRDTLPLETLYHDGLSLFFYARDQLFSGQSMSIPTFVKENKAKTYISYTSGRRSVETDFIEYPVDVIGFTGNAGFVGLFGLTGDFEGWFSNDDARIPIKANMKVIIGSVTLELISWKRGDWVPPRGEDE